MTDVFSATFSGATLAADLVETTPAATAIGSLVLGIAAWKLIDLTTRLYEQRQPTVRGAARDGRVVVPLVRLALRVILLIGVATAIVSNLAVNVALPLAIVGAPASSLIHPATIARMWYSSGGSCSGTTARPGRLHGTAAGGCHADV